MKKLYMLSLLVLTLSTVMGCDWNSSDKTGTSTEDKTHIMHEELSDLPPDFTLNDAPSVFDVVNDHMFFNSYLKLLNKAYVIDEFKKLQNVTVFAPTNAGINSIAEDMLVELEKPTNLESLRYLLNYHIVKDEYDYDRLESTIRIKDNMFRIKTLNGRFIALSIKGNRMYITDESGNQSFISKPDLEAENGVVHGIDNVLQPQKVSEK